MCVVHDLAEAQGSVFCSATSRCDLYSFSAVGDITPHEGISKAEKKRLEQVCPLDQSSLSDELFTIYQEAMHNFVHDMLHGSPAALRIKSIWQVSSLLSSTARY
jgi:putative hydrolases of HD superfamily